MCFILHDFKGFSVLELRSENMKRVFSNSNNLGTHHPFRLKSGQNAEINHTNYILLKRFQGLF